MKTSTKIVLAILVAALAWYYFKGSKKPCCAGCADGSGCEGEKANAATAQGVIDDDLTSFAVAQGAANGFFYDATKSKWVKKQPARFIDDDLTSF